MGHYEDLWYDIHTSLERYGLQKEFDAQLEKMNSQEKHRFKDSRSRWSYAHEKVIKQYNKKK